MLLELVRYYKTKPIMAVNEIWLTELTQMMIDLLVNSYWPISANWNVIIAKC